MEGGEGKKGKKRDSVHIGSAG